MGSLHCTIPKLEVVKELSEIQSDYQIMGFHCQLFKFYSSAQTEIISRVLFCTLCNLHIMQCGFECPRYLNLKIQLAHFHGGSSARNVKLDQSIIFIFL